MTNRYQNGLVYKLCCNDPQITDFYVGSCCNFSRRKSTHKTACTNENVKDYHYPVYQFIRLNGGWKNWSMIELEKYTCNSKRELEKREREVMQELKATLNKSVPTRSPNERYEDNKETILQYHKEYYHEHKIEHSEYCKQYYQNNREKLRELNKLKAECSVCGKMVKKKYLKSHQKSQKCLKIKQSKELNKCNNNINNGSN